MREHMHHESTQAEAVFLHTTFPEPREEMKNLSLQEFLLRANDHRIRARTGQKPDLQDLTQKQTNLDHNR